MVRLIYYLDVLSSWCFFTEPALARVRERFGDRISYEWRIAWGDGGPANYTPEQMAWFYRRSGSITGVELNPAWLRSREDGSHWADLAAEAARELGCSDDRVRLALARTCLVEGRRLVEREAATEVAAAAGGLERAALARAMDDPAIEARLRGWAHEFKAMGATQRPTFVLRNGIDDVTMLSGNFRYEPLAACVQAMLDDEEGYRAFEASNEPMPA